MSLRLTWRGGSGRSGVRRKTDFVKDEFIRKCVFRYTDRSEIVRFFMQYFKEKQYSNTEITAISSFLKRHGLTRAERHAVVFHLGYRYKAKPLKQNNMLNLRINGYYNHQKRVGE